METAPILAWTLVSECPIPDDVVGLLVDREKPVAAYKTFRESGCARAAGMSAGSADAGERGGAR